MTDQERLQLARQAEALLNNTAWQAALARRRQQLLDSIEMTEPGQTAEREALYLELRALKGVEGSLKAVLLDGQAIEHRQTLRRVRNG